MRSLSSRDEPQFLQQIGAMSSVTSGVEVFISVCPSCPLCPPGFLSLLLRNDLVRRKTSSFIFSLLGGVLLLPLSFVGSSYFDRRFLNSLFSFVRCSFERVRLQIIVCCSSMVLRIDETSLVSFLSTTDMSVTCLFIDAKVRKILGIYKKIQHNLPLNTLNMSYLEYFDITG